MRYPTRDHRQKPRPDAEYDQFVGTKWLYEHSFEDWLADGGLTLSTVTSVAKPAGAVTITDETVNATSWLANVTTVLDGEVEIVLTATSTASNSLKAIVRINVHEP